jgi:hypothetical protein
MLSRQFGDAHAGRILSGDVCTLLRTGLRWTAKGLAFSFRLGEADPLPELVPL